MRIAEFVLSAIVAFAIAYVIFDSQKSDTFVELSNTLNGYTIKFNETPTALSDSSVSFLISVSGPKDSTLKYWYRYAGFGQDESTRLYLYKRTPLTLMDADSGKFQAMVSTGASASVLRYYFEVRDPIGRLVVDLKDESGSALSTKVIGRVDSWIYYALFLTMFIAIFAVTKAAIGSISIAGGKGSSSDVKTFFILGLIFSFVSAFLLRNWYGLQLNAEAWQAVPFGKNLGDNLQQILMLYLVLIIVLTEKAKRAVSKNVIGYMGIFSFFLMAAAYLLPLVLSSDSFPVSIVSYVLIAIILLMMIFSGRAVKNA